MGKQISKGNFIIDLQNRVFVVSKALGMSLGLCLVILVAFFGLTQGPVQAQSPPPTGQDVVFLLDNSPSTITGEGSPDGNPTDPQDVRLRLTRFSVGALGLFTTTTQQRIGAISFARPAEVLVPLTAVEDWARADQARIQALDMGSGTNFAVALAAAAEMLAESNCTTETRCDVIFISDGVFDRPTQERQAVVAALESLRARGIQVHLLVFALPDAQSHIIWEALLAQGLLARYETRITPRFQDTPQDVYALLFDILNATHLFDDFSSIVAPAVITHEVPPYRRWVRWQIVTDQPAAPLFTVEDASVMPLHSGNEYFFWQEPLGGNWEITFDQDAVVYYRQEDMPLPLFVHVSQFPDNAVSGEEIFVQAGLVTAWGSPVTQAEHFLVTATVAGPSQTFALPLLRTDAQFSGVITTTALPSGVYTVTFSASAESDLAVSLPSVTRTFQITEATWIPSPVLSVYPSSVVHPGDNITITLEQCVGACQPTVLLVGSGYTTVVTLRPGGASRYQITVPLSNTVALVKGENVLLATVERISVPTFPVGNKQISYWLLVVIFLGVVSILGWWIILFKDNPLIRKLEQREKASSTVLGIVKSIIHLVEDKYEEFEISPKMNELRKDKVAELLNCSVKDGKIEREKVTAIFDVLEGRNRQ